MYKTDIGEALDKPRVMCYRSTSIYENESTRRYLDEALGESESRNSRVGVTGECGACPREVGCATRRGGPKRINRFDQTHPVRTNPASIQSCSELEVGFQPSPIFVVTLGCFCPHRFTLFIPTLADTGPT